MRLLCRTRLLCALLLAAVLLPAPAQAASAPAAEAPRKPKHGAPPPPTVWTIEEWGHHARPQQLALELGLWLDGVAPGLWLALPIADDGLLQSVNDSLDVEFGALFAYSRGTWWQADAALGLVASGGLRWNFFLTDKWTTFASLKLNFAFGLAGVAPLFFYPALSLGGLYRLGKVAQLRLEAGNPFGLAAGLSFDL